MMNWHPKWWNESEHGSAWSRVREAMRRDWEQTKHDLHLKGGHELNQRMTDTVEQIQGIQEPPSPDRPNPPKVVGELGWDEVEEPIGYGYAARRKYGTDHPKWNDRLEGTLKSEWDGAKDTTRRGWDDVRRWVRHGYEYEGRH